MISLSPAHLPAARGQPVALADLAVLPHAP